MYRDWTSSSKKKRYCIHSIQFVGPVCTARNTSVWGGNQIKGSLITFWWMLSNAFILTFCSSISSNGCSNEESNEGKIALNIRRQLLPGGHHLAVVGVCSSFLLQKGCPNMDMKTRVLNSPSGKKIQTSIRDHEQSWRGFRRPHRIRAPYRKI